MKLYRKYERTKSKSKQNGKKERKGNKVKKGYEMRRKGKRDEESEDTNKIGIEEERKCAIDDVVRQSAKKEFTKSKTSGTEKKQRKKNWIEMTTSETAEKFEK